uniref:Uncharacterized protein n=1 Tax=Globodera pallida TaxID=36090 RepID=A0A183BUH2_GLOPA
MEKRVEKLEHENKELRAELEHQKQLKEQLERKIDESLKSVQAMVDAELEKCQNKQQQTIDELTEKLKVSIEQLSLMRQGEHEKLSNANKNLIEEIKEQREMDLAELEKQKLSNANKFAEIEQKNSLQHEKIVKLEQYQKEQQQRRRRLPLELKCEVISALPFQHGRYMLLLCRSIAKNCIALVRKQKAQFEVQSF